MDWVPESIKEIRLLIDTHEFAGGIPLALVFIAFMRHYFFRSSERVLQQMNDELKRKCKDLEKALRQEQDRVQACHKELEAQQKLEKEARS